ncbi:hypothetical protein C8F04DRAFT_1020184 [Mycena alexandri]|uniref:Uncharacterized protein n=1 Tax=Mycena alexandri TaxID=1745969 RepID=A0AAD6RW29_9AGAR|nr:hypothetical protein C8F04DRAFT_1020184 [Mycena alexandri]
MAPRDQNTSQISLSRQSHLALCRALHLDLVFNFYKVYAILDGVSRRDRGRRPRAPGRIGENGVVRPAVTRCILTLDFLYPNVFGGPRTAAPPPP